MATTISTNRYLTPAEYRDSVEVGRVRAEMRELLLTTELAEGECFAGPVVHTCREVARMQAACPGEICLTATIEVAEVGDLLEPDGSVSPDSHWRRAEEAEMGS